MPLRLLPQSPYVTPSPKSSTGAQQPEFGLTCCPVRPFAPLRVCTKDLTADIFHWPPPHKKCGFFLPLPASTLDGHQHQLHVKIREWRPIKAAPESRLNWHCGSVFGAVARTTAGFYEGWVSWRLPTVTSESLPHLIVSQYGPEDAKAYALKPVPARAGAHCSAEFRIRTNDLKHFTTPVFSCQGVALRNTTPEPDFKPIGLLESVDADGIRGWALNSLALNETMPLVLLMDGLPLCTVRPNIRRKDIAEHLGLLAQELGIAGFHLPLPPELKDGRPHTLTLACKAGGQPFGEQPLHYRHHAMGWTVEQARRFLQTSLPLHPPSITTVAAQAVSAVQTHPSDQVLIDAVNPALQVSIVILNRNGARCLQSLFESWQLYNSLHAVEFIVVDHASHDDSLAVLTLWQSRLRLRVLALNLNDSFSASCNRGARMAQAPYLLFLNNDIVWQHDALPSLISTLQDPNVGVVGLKLLKTEFEASACSAHPVAVNPARDAQIQHLGVRYTLVGNRYWPYEVSRAQGESVYGPQDVPVVTAAVMLCRTAEFLKLRGFDERYVYGFEDVEYCLRLTHRTGQRVVCRNDLVALHHHGYTRLTGREPAMFDHQTQNQRQLWRQTGHWIRRAWWQSLISADRHLCADCLNIGIAFETPVTDGQTSPASQRQLHCALSVAEQLQAHYPQAQVLLLPSGQDWLAVGHLNVLVAVSPRYDLRECRHPRADLRCAALLIDVDSVSTWSDNPCVYLFDRLLTIPPLSAGKASGLLKRQLRLNAAPRRQSRSNDSYNLEVPIQPMLGTLPPVSVSTTHEPLSTLMDPNMLSVHLRSSRATGHEDDASFEAQSLLKLLRAEGFLVSHSHTGCSSPLPRVTDVQILLHTRPTESFADAAPKPVPDEDCLNVLWLPFPIEMPPNMATVKPDAVWLGNGVSWPNLHTPAIQTQGAHQLRQAVRQLQQMVEERIGRTFHTP